MKGSPADRTKEATGKDKAEVFRGGEWGGNYTSPKVAEASQEKNPSASNPWESSVDNSKQSAAWQSRSTHVKQACSWGDSADTSAASVKTGSQTSNWDNVKTSTTSERDKSKQTVETGNWNTTANDGGWGASTSSATAPAETGGPTGNWDNVSTSGPSAWEKSKPEGASETGSWNNTGFSSESQTNGWNKQKLSNVDQTSGWNKAGTAEGGKDGWKDSLDKQKNSVGHSSGQWSAGNAKTNGSDWGGGSNWSQGRSNNENFSTSDRSNSWNDQKDFDGGRAYNRGRGRGRYGGRGFRNGENSGKPGDSDVSWRFGRGFRNEDNSGKPDDSDGNWKFGRGGSRGRGRNGGCSFNRDSSDDTQQFGRGRGRGRGRGNGRGQFESSDWWKSRQSSENDGGSSIKSDWGVTEASGWSSGWSGSSGGNAEISAGNMDQKVGWSGKSSGGQRSSGWGNVPGEVKDYTITDHTSGWNQSSKSDATVGESKWNSKIASGWSGSRGGNAEKSAGNMDQKVGWSSGKSLGGVGSSGWGNASDITGEVKDDTIIDRSSCWNHSLKSDATLGDAKWNSKIATSSQPVDWKMKEIKSASTSNSTEPSFADWVHGLPQNKASTNEGNWSNEKSSPRDDAGRLTANDWCQSSTAKKEKHSSDNDCGWGGHDENTRGNYSSSANDHIWAKGKEPSSDSKSVCTGIWGSSKGWGDNSGEQGQQSTTAWETSKEPNSKSNWSGQASDSSGNQISGWNNGGGNQWSKPKAFGVDDQFASNDSLYKGSGNQAQSGNWRHESDQGQPFGGRGRGNTFSTRGRGRGRNYGGRHSYGWNSGDGSGRDGNRYNDRRDTSHSNQNELKSGGGWSSGAIAEKGSWDSWKSERQSQPAGWANMSSGKGDSSKSSWDSPKDCGSSRSGWESASDKENATSEVGGEVHKKISDGADGAGGWNTKGSDGRSGQ
ncbi:hypothetical protein AXF42_Ash012149 [Apostasia shenzhenica]|uniref:Uncharacterized protein n=1 Tax=Apostasia shenzhenica TaxID=1088818 RepID=A0A2I0B442_9ASPA|nr:hypothetical protein AXF42_Ash012149 [Apostasia shenzhenica]